MADYLLFVDRKAIGVVEAKPVGTTLSGVEAQSGKYGVGLPAQLPAWHRPLPFLYESTGVETFFTNGLDPQPRSRRVFAFHRPETLLRVGAGGRRRCAPGCAAMPPLITTGLWDAQVEAITNLERSLADDRPRALIQMATGCGKTFTAVSFIYRLIKFARARRVLFLVDRSNLGRQTLQGVPAVRHARRRPQVHRAVQRPAPAPRTRSTRSARSCITTIQRLYSMLSGEPELDAESWRSARCSTWTTR